MCKSQQLPKEGKCMHLYSKIYPREAAIHPRLVIFTCHSAGLLVGTGSKVFRMLETADLDKICYKLLMQTKLPWPCSVYLIHLLLTLALWTTQMCFPFSPLCCKSGFSPILVLLVGFSLFPGNVLELALNGSALSDGGWKWGLCHGGCPKHLHCFFLSSLDCYKYVCSGLRDLQLSLTFKVLGGKCLTRLSLVDSRCRMMGEWEWVWAERMHLFFNASSQKTSFLLHVPFPIQLRVPTSLSQ